jgi:aminocarboxymuconate-semialdehyde decarboxylase
MRIVDSHFHWYPSLVFEQLSRRRRYPRAERNAGGGYTYSFNEGRAHVVLGPEWFDLESQLAAMDETGHEVDVVCSAGPSSGQFCDLPADEGRDIARAYNEQMAGAQARYAGRLWAAAIVPLQDTRMALEVLEEAIGKQGLMGVCVPGSVGREPIDAERLEPFYARVEQLGVPVFLHPTDTAFRELLDGYAGSLHNTLGRVMDVSVSGLRLVLSGIMERYPRLKIFQSHTGGALPYIAGRLNKNNKLPLAEAPSTYVKRMYTDTVAPQALSVRFAVDFYEAGLSKDDQVRILCENARRVLGLGNRVEAAAAA